MDAGLLAPTPIVKEPLRETTPAAAIAAYDVACRLAEVRPPGEPFPIANTFLCSWGQMPLADAIHGRGWLARNRYITRVGEADFGAPIRAHLWLLGDHPDRR